MALFAGELNEVAPKRPVDVCVVGTYIFSAFQNDATSGLMPNGAFAVLSTSTEVALAYTGLPSSQGVGNFNAFSAASGGGYAWVIPNNLGYFYRITPTTGAVTSYWISSPDALSYAWGLNATSTHIIAHRIGLSTVARISLSTFTVSMSGSSAAIVGRATSDGSILHYINGNGNYATYDPTTDTFTVIGAAGAADPTGRGFVDSGLWWYPTATGVVSKMTTSPYTATTYTHTLTPGGNIASTSDLVKHSDGKFYAYGASDYLIAFDPSNGSFGKEALTPSRSRRYNLCSAAGKLWLPSGEPLN